MWVLAGVGHVARCAFAVRSGGDASGGDAWNGGSVRVRIIQHVPVLATSMVEEVDFRSTNAATG